MRNRSGRRSVLFTLLILSVFFLTNQATAAPKPRNIIVISIDTLRADHLGCYGYPLNTSPNIDTFAEDGILFTDCYAHTPLTTPSFSTMMTSLPPYKHGAKRNGLSIYKKIKTFPHFLKRYGYKTAAVISNWPLRKKMAGLHKGFDVYHQVFHRKRYLGIMNAEGQAPAVTEKAVNWLDKNSHKRFFLWVQYTDPHALYILHKEFVFNYNKVPASTYPPKTRMKKIRRYDSEIGFTDFYIGKLLDRIKKLGLYDDALIIINADHGESFGEHNYFKHGRKLYNSTLHVPLIIKLPKNRQKGTRFTENVGVIDLAFTIFGILNLPIHPQMEGVPVLETEPSVLHNRQIILETYAGAIIFKRKNRKFKLKVKPIRYGVLKNNTKLIVNTKAGTSEAYLFKTDPFETRNIFSSQSDSWPYLQEMRKTMGTEISRIKQYIKLKRGLINQQKGISEDDMKKLKSLGYF